MDVCCECCVLSVRGLWVGLITRPEFCRLWSRRLDNEEALAHYGLLRHVKEIIVMVLLWPCEIVLHRHVTSPQTLAISFFSTSLLIFYSIFYPKHVLIHTVNYHHVTYGLISQVKTLCEFLQQTHLHVFMFTLCMLHIIIIIIIVIYL